MAVHPRSRPCDPQVVAEHLIGVGLELGEGRRLAPALLVEDVEQTAVDLHVERVVRPVQPGQADADAVDALGSGHGPDGRGLDRDSAPTDTGCEGSALKIERLAEGGGRRLGHLLGRRPRLRVQHVHWVQPEQTASVVPSVLARVVGGGPGQPRRLLHLRGRHGPHRVAVLPSRVSSDLLQSVDQRRDPRLVRSHPGEPLDSTGGGRTSDPGVSEDVEPRREDRDAEVVHVDAQALGRRLQDRGETCRAASVRPQALLQVGRQRRQQVDAVPSGDDQRHGRGEAAAGLVRATAVAGVADTPARVLELRAEPSLHVCVVLAADSERVSREERAGDRDAEAVRGDARRRALTWFRRRAAPGAVMLVPVAHRHREPDERPLVRVGRNALPLPAFDLLLEQQDSPGHRLLTLLLGLAVRAHIDPVDVRPRRFQPARVQRSRPDVPGVLAPASSAGPRTRHRRLHPLVDGDVPAAGRRGARPVRRGDRPQRQSRDRQRGRGRRSRRRDDRRTPPGRTRGPERLRPSSGGNGSQRACQHRQ